MKEVSSEVFRAYDIRGVVDRDFNPQWVEMLGRSLGVFFVRRKRARVIVGRDVRHSSPEYSLRIIKGLVSSGLDVLNIGPVATPMFYFAHRHLGIKAGVMVTASHNPPEYNGFKLWNGETTFSPEDIQEVREIMNASAGVPGHGVLGVHNIEPAYLGFLSGLSKMLDGEDAVTRVKVVVDGGNGMGGEVTARLLEMLGADVVRLFCEPDGSFPNHHPDPVVEDNLDNLKRAVIVEGADIGIGLDGDGDRIGVVDEKGKFMPCDQLLAILAGDELSRIAGGLILADVKCSHLLFNNVELSGGRAEMSVTGHSVMKAKMLETGAILGGELSGHMFFGGPMGGLDDATYAAARMVSILSRSNEPLSRMPENWADTHATPEIRTKCSEGIKFRVVEEAGTIFRDMAAEHDFEIIDVDGVRLVFSYGWALLRASNTQPVLVTRFEAETVEQLEFMRKMMESVIVAIKSELNDNE